MAKITGDGVFIEALERDVGKYLPEVCMYVYGCI